MIVVVMIGILVALGIPTIGAQMRDRRTTKPPTRWPSCTGKLARLPWAAAQRCS